MIESFIPVTSFINHNSVAKTESENEPLPLIGIYLSTGPNEQPDPSLIDELSKLYSSRTGEAPAYYLILDLGHQGRMDALLYSDRELSQVQPFAMLDDGNLYPDSSNR